jgi:hypothetical protein
MIINEIKKDVFFIKGHTLQPKWFKFIKIIFLITIFVISIFIFGVIKAVIWFLSFLFLGFLIHMLYRIKTNTFTRSWMDFHVTKSEKGLEYKRIGILYYSLVFLAFSIPLALIILFG